MDECTCQTPGDRNKDFIVAIGPNGKLAWYARKDCPLHGMKEIGLNDMPATDQAE